MTWVLGSSRFHDTSTVLAAGISIEVLDRVLQCGRAQVYGHLSRGQLLVTGQRLDRRDGGSTHGQVRAEPVSAGVDPGVPLARLRTARWTRFRTCFWLRPDPSSLHSTRRLRRFPGGPVAEPAAVREHPVSTLPTSRVARHSPCAGSVRERSLTVLAPGGDILSGSIGIIDQ